MMKSRIIRNTLQNGGDGRPSSLENKAITPFPDEPNGNIQCSSLKGKGKKYIIWYN